MNELISVNDNTQVRRKIVNRPWKGPSKNRPSPDWGVQTHEEVITRGNPFKTYNIYQKSDERLIDTRLLYRGGLDDDYINGFGEGFDKSKTENFAFGFERLAEYLKQEKIPAQNGRLDIEILFPSTAYPTGGWKVFYKKNGAYAYMIVDAAGNLAEKNENAPPDPDIIRHFILPQYPGAETYEKVTENKWIIRDYNGAFEAFMLDGKGRRMEEVSPQEINFILNYAAELKSAHNNAWHRLGYDAQNGRRTWTVKFYEKGFLRRLFGGYDVTEYQVDAPSRTLIKKTKYKAATNA